MSDWYILMGDLDTRPTCVEIQDPLAAKSAGVVPQLGKHPSNGFQVVDRVH